MLVTAPGGQPTQLGAPAAVTIRPPIDPGGVGLDIAFANIPNTFDGLPLQLHEINSTLKSLKLTVLVKDSRGRRTKASVQIRSLHLPKN